VVPVSDSFIPEFLSLNPTTGAATFVGNTGTNFAGDIAFQPTPEPSSVVLFGIGVALIAARRLRRGLKI
jgi:hypothetical protein